MNWQQQQVNLYSDHLGQGCGRVRTLRDVLFSDFSDNISDIVSLRTLDYNTPGYDVKRREIKSHLQLHSVAALLHTRSKEVPESERINTKTALTQIDIDHVEQQGYDIEEMKQFLFSFPFTCFVSRSCSGDGVYAIIALATTSDLKAYMRHLSRVFKQSGIEIDTSKGSNYTDLRYVSYDANMLWRNEVDPLCIKHLPKEHSTRIRPTGRVYAHTPGNHTLLIKSQVNNILAAQKGQRWATIQAAAYTLGGVNDGLEILEEAIRQNTAFAGEETKYIKCAADCFRAGQQKPFVQ